MRAGGRPFRPPVGLPSPRERRWRAALVSVVVHGLVALLLLVPAIAALIVHVSRTSAGAAGARGGSGGGGHLLERLRFVQTPLAAPPTPTPPRPGPTPVVRPPEPKPPPPTSSVPGHDSSAVAQAPGDGAGRNGPGGRTGAGVGNAVGPGAGGGSPTATKIHAATDVMTLATIDPPKRPRPFQLHAVFAVDVHGDARLLRVNKADDGDFNRAMETRLKETHFKAATLPDGTPVPDTVSIDIDY